MLVSDFDGTMTKYDFFELARRNLASADDYDHWQDYVAGRKTHFDAVAGIFASIRTDWQGIDGILDAMELDPALPEALARLEAAGWKIVVASAGCRWYIERLLDRAGVRLEIHANPGTFAPETGLVLERPVESPYYLYETGIDKSAIMQAALAEDADAVFAGDGRPDLAPASLVKPSHCFARGWLADQLSQQGTAYHRFERWSQIADQLLEST